MEGHFEERFEPEAFDKTMRENKNIKILFQHGKDPQVGAKVIGSPRLLERDELGVRYEVDLFEDAPYVVDNVLPGLKRGEYGVSFTWRMLKHRDTPAKRGGGLLQRSVTEAFLREFGPVTFPAYKGASIRMRSLTDEFVLGHLTDAETPLWLPREEQEPEPVAESDEATTPPDEASSTEEPAERSEEPEPAKATTQARERTTPVRDYLKRGKGQEPWRL
jgi:HK97 family phage prohead protease